MTSMVDKTMNDVQRGLAWFICVSFILLIFVWVLRPPVMAPESMAQLNQLVATLQNILLLAIGFFFGSSKSSQNKDDAIMKSALSPTPPPPVSTTTTTTPAATTTVTEPSGKDSPSAV
jgi:hypothetical protein